MYKYILYKYIFFGYEVIHICYRAFVQHVAFNNNSMCR